MTVPSLTWALLDQAADHAGFDSAGPTLDDWRMYSSRSNDRFVWLTALESTYFVALPSWDLAQELRPLAEVTEFTGRELPPGAAGALGTTDRERLRHLIKRVRELGTSLPEGPLEAFHIEVRNLPSSTEAERQVIQRVGQDIFRDALLKYWAGCCAVTGLDVTPLLRASHIKPWKDCITEAERLDVFNGLLLAPHLDAVFDAGYVTWDTEGRIVLSSRLDTNACSALGLSSDMRLRLYADAHRRYMAWHRHEVFERWERSE